MVPATDAACELTRFPCAGGADVAVVRAPGYLNHAGTADQLDRELAAATRRAGVRVIVVELGASSSIGSLALRVLVRHARSGRQRGVRLHLVCVDSNILSILEMTLLDRLLPASPSFAAAMEYEARAN